jgi:hypothetical protein
MKRLFIIVMSEAILLILVTSIFLFIFKIFPLNSSSFLSAPPSQLPIQSDVKNVKIARVLYMFNGKVLEIKELRNGTTQVVFEESPKNPITVSSTMIVNKLNAPAGRIPVTGIQKGDSININTTYDLKSQKWNTSVGLPKPPANATLIVPTRPSN